MIFQSLKNLSVESLENEDLTNLTLKSFDTHRSNCVIYESRPNVTADVAALCLKSGNCSILRGGSEAFHTNKIFKNYFVKV